MFKPKVKELPVPPAAKEARDAVEMARVWAANGGLHVSLSPALWDDPANWGVALVDLARHVANFYVQERGMDGDAVLARIKALLDAEWDTPTSDVVGGATH